MLIQQIFFREITACFPLTRSGFSSPLLSSDHWISEGVDGGRKGLLFRPSYDKHGPKEREDVQPTNEREEEMDVHQWQRKMHALLVEMEVNEHDASLTSLSFLMPERAKISRPPNLIRKNNYLISLFGRSDQREQVYALSTSLSRAHSLMHTHRFHPTRQGSAGVILLRPARLPGCRPPLHFQAIRGCSLQLSIHCFLLKTRLAEDGYFERPRGREPNMTN